MSVVVADLLNTTILYNECGGSPRSKNEAMRAEIHQKRFSGQYGWLSPVKQIFSF